MRHPLKVCGIAALGFALAGCVTAPMDRASTGPSRMGFDGRWGDTTGVAVSTLQGGTFTSTATDTGFSLLCLLHFALRRGGKERNDEHEP